VSFPGGVDAVVVTGTVKKTVVPLLVSQFDVVPVTVPKLTPVGTLVKEMSLAQILG
jgi:hypothetical protein